MLQFSFIEITECYKRIQEDLGNKVGIEELKQKYQSPKGELNLLLRSIGKQDFEKRSQFGKEINELKEYFQLAIDTQESNQIEKSEIENKIDVTAPYDINTPEEKRPKLLNNQGKTHPIYQELEIILRIFESMGFEALEARQLDDDYHMFTSVNFPEGHPARDMWDTFWTDENLIPTTHTSTMQNRAYKMHKKPPIRMVIPGMCYRNEATDATHEFTLMQLEGVYVDEGISMGDMIGVLKKFLEAYYKMELEIKLQPSFFPFVEPGMEFCIKCPFCGGTGCRSCVNKGWIEILPFGMIHPNVLREGGIDPEKYTGFAWGAGIDRLISLKNSIDDIRRLRAGEIDFLKQF